MQGNELSAPWGRHGINLKHAAVIWGYGSNNMSPNLLANVDILEFN